MKDKNPYPPYSYQWWAFFAEKKARAKERLADVEDQSFALLSIQALATMAHEYGKAMDCKATVHLTIEMETDGWPYTRMSVICRRNGEPVNTLYMAGRPSEILPKIKHLLNLKNNGHELQTDDPGPADGGVHVETPDGLAGSDTQHDADL